MAAKETKSSSFIETMKNIRRGRFLELCQTQLTKLINEIHENGAGGEFTLSLKFEPKGDGQLTCKPKIKLKMPGPTVGDAIFYMDEDGNLERSDPRQGNFAFDDIGDAPKS